jgi:DNA-binding XRE family transcriptional regulator
MIYTLALQKRRKELGLSQEAMGERIGVSRVGYNDWEKGISVPTKKQWPAIELATGLRLMLIAVPADTSLTEGRYNFSNTPDHAMHETRSAYNVVADKTWQITRTKLPFK